ncbi:MAG: hypothetical protein E6G56_11270 [Actinobacteria bacterium]|nr:MAG: hypothetical protein E6G56_11270 [Actinomycetota bacterium]
MEALEQADEVPSDPREWPGGKAKYFTYGGGEDQSNEPYGDDITGKLGPSDVHHQPDGSVIVRGEKVDDPEKYKGEPIPGGPTDPGASDLPANRAARAQAKERGNEQPEEEGDSQQEEERSAQQEGA